MVKVKSILNRESKTMHGSSTPLNMMNQNDRYRLTPIDYIRDYQVRNNLSPSDTAGDLLISMSHYYKFFTDSVHKRSPSPHCCRIAQLLEFIKQNGLQPPAPVFED